MGIVGLGLLLTGLYEAFGGLRRRSREALTQGLVGAALGTGLLVVRQWSGLLLVAAIALVLVARAAFDLYRAWRGWRSGEGLWWYPLRALAQLLGAASLLILGEVAVVAVILAIGVAWVITGFVYLWQVFGPTASEASRRMDITETPQLATTWLQRRDIGEQARNQVLDKLVFRGRAYWERVGRFAALMGFSTVIAALGIQTDSTAVVIGAMLVAPLMTPILATSASLLMGWPIRALRSLALVGAGMAIAIGLSFLIARYAPEFVEVTVNSQVTSRTSPTLLDLMIALAAGAAGGYAVCRPDVSDSLPGVAIAVAVVPPLSVVGITLAAGEYGLAAGALLLFLTNLVGIIIASIAVFVAVGFLPWARMEAKREQLQRSMVTLSVALAVVAIPLAITGERILISAADHDGAVAATQTWLEQQPGLDFVQLDLDGGNVDIILAGPQSPSDVDGLAGDIAQEIGRDVEVDLRVVPEERFVVSSRDG